MGVMSPLQLPTALAYGEVARSGGRLHIHISGPTYGHMRTSQPTLRKTTQSDMVGRRGYKGGGMAAGVPFQIAFRISDGHMWGFARVAEPTYFTNRLS